MTSDLDSSPSVGDRARSRAYHRDFWPAAVAYALVLTAVLVWGGLDGTSPWRYLWALTPALPALWGVRAVVRQIRRGDEFQRLLSLESLAVGFAIAMVTALTIGFLGLAGFAPGPFPLAMGCWIVYGVGMLGWAVARAVLTHRATQA